MKKVLSTLLLISATVMIFAQNQIVVEENFESLNLGNVGTDVTATTPGQGNMLLQGGTVSNYQIANITAAQGKSLQLTSGNSYDTNGTNRRLVYKNFTATATVANDIVSSKFKIFTGAATGAGNIGVSIINSAGQIIGGLQFDYASKKIQGLANISLNTVPVQSGTVTVTYATIYPANTWLDLEHRYNKTTGAHTFIVNNGTPNLYTGGTVTLSGGATAIATVVPGLVAGRSIANNNTLTGNTIGNVAGIDDWQVKFGNTATLAVNEQNNVKNVHKLSIFPNPTTDILNIKSDSKINKVTVIDMTGRNMEVKLENDMVNVQALPVGSYLINIETKDGISTEKFIKK